jgi:hypothetical protein
MSGGRYLDELRYGDEPPPHLNHVTGIDAVAIVVGVVGCGWLVE